MNEVSLAADERSAFLQAVFNGVEPMGGWPEGFVIVTACNPLGAIVDAKRNESLDRELSAILKGKGLAHCRMTGGSPDGSHREPGYLVECDAQVGLELGRKFEQVAIYEVVDGELYLVDCQDGKQTPVAKWASRYRGR
ncbi:MAG: DUF3293 domain-containing protein [Verrucomicrobia bacterium]|nr:DUF3293 domain-containing protein [Verrucomicrobiota bacterium]